MGYLTSLGKYLRSQAADRHGELHQRKSKESMMEVEKVADHQKGRKGRLQDHKDGANHQGGEADHQDIAVVLQGGGVSHQDGAVGLGLHGDDGIVTNIKEVTLKDKRIKGTQIQSKFFFFFTDKHNIGNCQKLHVFSLLFCEQLVKAEIEE